MTSSIMTACCGVTGVFLCGKIHLKRCWHFCTFLHNPHFDFEPDCHQKAKKTMFPTIYCPNGNILNFSRTSRIYVETVIRQIDLPTPCAAMTPQSIYRLVTDRIKHHSISPVHSVHLADITMSGITRSSADAEGPCNVPQIQNIALKRLAVGQ